MLKTLVTQKQKDKQPVWFFFFNGQNIWIDTSSKMLYKKPNKHIKKLNY